MYCLVSSGYGNYDSINTISKLQYKDIIKYDSMYVLKNDVTKISDNLTELFKKVRL